MRVNSPIENRRTGTALTSCVRTATGAEGMVLLHTGTGRLFKLNPSGAAIWEGLAAECGPREIAARLAAQHHGESRALEAEVTAFAVRLRSLGLLASDRGL